MANPVGFDWFDPAKTMDLIEERQKLYEAQDHASTASLRNPGTSGGASKGTSALPELSERTQRWFDSLPRSARPNVMRCSFPHILDGIAKAWGEPKQLNEELNALLLIDRGTRKGFPFQVIQELHCVRDYYFEEFNPEGARQIASKNKFNDPSR